jgi:hypothetical protein
MKIFLGIRDIAGQMAPMAKALSARGHYCRFHNGEVNYLRYHSEAGYRQYMVPMPQSPDEYDIYDFFFAGGWNPEGIKAAGKKIVWHFCGSEVRQLSVAKALNPHAAVKFEDEEKIRESLKTMAEWSDACYIKDVELLPHIEPFFKRIWVIPRMYDGLITDIIRWAEGPPRVVHCPTDIAVKGTKGIIDAMSQLDKEGQIRFQLVYKMPHNKAIEAISNADIVIDQMCIGTFGQLAIEGMALGKAVVCYISDFMMPSLAHTPIVNSTPANLYTTVKELANSSEVLDIQEKGPDYVRRYHAPDIVAGQLEIMYEAL